MQSLRQLGSGVIIAIVSVVLVIGGISLALAETLPQRATPTPIPPTLPLSFPTPTITASFAPQTETGTATITETPPAVVPSSTNTLLAPTSCIPPVGWIRITVAAGDTVYSLAQRYKTTADALSAANCLSSVELPAGYTIYVPPVPTVTVIPCGPPAGWVKTHVVQAGDNLYRIALSYNITYPQLQRANCMGSSTTIYAGQILWVPNVPTLTPVPGVTFIPTFPTDTPMPTSTALPPTATSTTAATATTAATSTSVPTPLPTFTSTAPGTTSP